MTLLASIVALLIGPLLFNLTIKKPNMLDLFDGFIFVVIGGLVIFHILPETIAEAGLWSLLFVLVGLFGPTLAESLFHKAAALTHKTTLALGVFGLVLHSLTDGSALTDDPNFTQLTLIIAIIAHRLPVGLTVWWLLRPHFGKVIALSVLSLMAIGTATGSYFGRQWLPGLDPTVVALIESFIAGSVLHVVFHRPYAEHHHQHKNTTTHYDGVGSLLGLACLVAILLTGHQDDAEHGLQQLDLLVQLAYTLSPFLLLAYAMSSFSKFLFSDNHPIHMQSSHPTKFQILRGALLGLPLPFCIPDATKAYQLLRKQGAHASMALAFLISAPILGFESLLISLPLLGWEMTAIRLACAVVIVIVLALIMVRWVTEKKAVQASAQAEIAHRLKHSLRHGYEHLLDHTAPWIFVGLILASLLTHGQHQAQWFDLLIVAVAAIPFRLCATGITPLAAAMMVSGWSPGSALVLMLLGPTISLELLRFMIKEHGNKLASAFIILLPTTVILFASLIDMTVGNAISTSLQLDHSSPAMIEIVSLGIILLLVSWSLLRRGARAFVAELLPKLQLFSHKH
jgi:uncharacterized protein